MKKVLAVWENSSSESEKFEHTEDASLMAVKEDDKIFNQIFRFMVNSKDDDEPMKEVTLSNFNQNLHIFSTKKLMKLAAILINSTIELTTKKNALNNQLDLVQNEKITLIFQLSEVEKHILDMELDNLTICQKLNEETKGYQKGKETTSNLQLEIEASLNDTEEKHAIALERNTQLERDLA